jgi:hypothetical protein
MNHDAITTGDAHVRAQIEAVPHQSDAYRELDAKIRAAAGDKLGALKIRIKSTGAVALIGYEHARERILGGVADLAE